MGFEEAAVVRAMAEAGGNVMLALEKLLHHDEQAQAASAGTPTSSRGVGGQDGEPPDLASLVALLEVQLRVSGGPISVVDEACTQLNVPRRRGSVHERAIKCWQALGAPAPQLPVPTAVPAAGSGSSASSGGVAMGLAVNLALDAPSHLPTYSLDMLAQGAAAAGGGEGSGATASSSREATVQAWTCAVCTYAHDTPQNKGYLSCEMCGAPKP